MFGKAEEAIGPIGFGEARTVPVQRRFLSWRQRGVPVEDVAELAEWAMSEPGIFEGFTRNQETADTREAIEDPELEGEIREAVAGWRASPTGRAWRGRTTALYSACGKEGFQVGR
jgi:hypothetical protein